MAFADFSIYIGLHMAEVTRAVGKYHDYERGEASR
jgi:hypothetical protein